MPLRHDVEHLALPEAFGAQGERHAELDDVRDDLVALVLEVVLGQPHRVVAELVGCVSPLEEVVVRGEDIGHAVAARRGNGPGVARVGHGHRAEEEDVELHVIIEPDRSARARFEPVNVHGIGNGS